MRLALSAAPERGGEFLTTRWSVVLAAGDVGTSSARAHAALAELCGNYWQPLYLFLRREGYGRRMRKI